MWNQFKSEQLQTLDGSSAAGAGASQQVGFCPAGLTTRPVDAGCHEPSVTQQQHFELTTAADADPELCNHHTTAKLTLFYVPPKADFDPQKVATSGLWNT